MPSAFTNLPSSRQGPAITPRNIILTATSRKMLATNAIIDGTKTRDVGQAANGNPTSLLRDGLPLGKSTTGGKYANSFIGLTTAPMQIGATTLTANAAVITEVVRRIGASGTLTLTGYSDPVPAINQVEAMPVVDTTGVGTFTMTIEGTTTGAITYSAIIATLITNINTALNTTFGTGAIVASGASLAALILTFSGAGYGGRPIVGHSVATITISSGSFTINGSTTVGTTTTTTAGATVQPAGVRQTYVPYSAASGTTITITPVESDSVAAVNQVEAMPVVDTTGVGAFTLTIEGLTTAAITYSATFGTLITNINSALNTTFGVNAIVASASSLATLIVTFSGPGYAGRPINGHVVSTITVTSGNFTINGSNTSGISTTTTAGVAYSPASAGPYVAGALIGPSDGTQVPIVVLYQGSLAYLDTTDLNNSNQDVVLPGFLTSADLYANAIQFLTADDFGTPTPLAITLWLEGQLNSNAGNTYTYSNTR